MFPLNTPQKMPTAAFVYLILGHAILGIAMILAGLFLSSITPQQSSAAAATAGLTYAPFLGLLLIGVGIFVPVWQWLWCVLFTFTLTPQGVTVRSGILIRESKTINYDRVQNVDNVRGPIEMLFGITQINIWTSSQDQLNSTTTFENGVATNSTDAVPEAMLYLLRHDAEALQTFISGKGAVQDVNVVTHAGN